MPSTKRPSSFTIIGPPPNEPGHRTLVCAVKGISNRVCIVAIRADAPMAEQQKKIYQANAADFSDITAAMLRLFSTKLFPGDEWARLDTTQNIENPPFEGCLGWSFKLVGDYFPPNIARVGSGVVHVLVQPEIFLWAPNPHPPQLSLPDDKPTSTDFAEDSGRCYRIKEAMDLVVTWEIQGTYFSALHTYTNAQWLEYERYCGIDRSRDFIGDKKTW